MKPYLKTIAKDFLNTFHENEISAAKIELFLYEEEGIEDQLDKLLTEYFCPSPKDKEMLAAIEQTDEPVIVRTILLKTVCISSCLQRRITRNGSMSISLRSGVNI